MLNQTLMMHDVKKVRVSGSRQGSGTTVLNIYVDFDDGKGAKGKAIFTLFGDADIDVDIDLAEGGLQHAEG